MGCTSQTDLIHYGCIHMHTETHRYKNVGLVHHLNKEVRIYFDLQSTSRLWKHGKINVGQNDRKKKNVGLVHLLKKKEERIYFDLQKI